MGGVNSSDACLNSTQLKINSSEAEKYVLRYVYSVIIAIGITGNVLNLTVLLRRSMKSRSNSFLAALAFADILFLILLLPNVLANFPFFGNNYTFRYIYFHTKVHLLSLNNWASGIAIWCVIVGSADRLLGIKYPLYVKNEWEWYALPGIVGTIVVITRGLSLYQHFEYSCKYRSFCKGTQLLSVCFPVVGDSFGQKPNPFPPTYRSVITVCKIVNAFMMIILPIVLLTILNALLLLALRRRTNSLLHGELQRNRSTRDAQAHYARTEHRVTVTVALIVTAFTITHGPSALMQFIDWKDSRYPTLVCNTLVIIGKAINFILFCLSSKHFRRRLIQLARRNVNKQVTKFSTLSTLVNDSGSSSRRLSRTNRHKRSSTNDLLER